MEHKTVELIRKLHGMTQTGVALKMELSLGRYNELEKGKYKMPEKFKIKFMKLFKISETDFEKIQKLISSLSKKKTDIDYLIAKKILKLILEES